ncbi:hypothetical protein [Kordiimonas sp. SCSIO 12610]|uniref:hypothetical protein n=1 Tax=Kordiimonas sp. SCSIO 12610 TaxID=2829597 RepID=UPI00210C8A62|nr:hypothetical protein [Kordiimonas sp. SCSIO 12610]UTW56315.1 hypothetical protein KFF44_05275 [Kordiimonas sp. SCSIO 12610]
MTLTINRGALARKSGLHQFSFIMRRGIMGADTMNADITNGEFKIIGSKFRE